MGPKFGGGVKCLVCDKTVYAAEEIKAIGNSYHKMCFKCVTCNKVFLACSSLKCLRLSMPLDPN